MTPLLLLLACRMPAPFVDTQETSSPYIDLPDTEAPQSVTVGPIVGGVSSTTATVMVRGSVTGELELELDDWTSEPQAVGSESDYTTHFYLENLEPSTTYQYRILDREGSFRTPPPPGQHEDFGFVVFADAVSNDEGKTSDTYVMAGTLDISFALQIGDLDHRNPGDVYPHDIDNWRQMYREQLAEFSQGETLQQHILHKAPLFHVWDDHDYGADDVYYDAPFKEISTQAFYEYFPMPADMPNQAQGIWHKIQWGIAELYFLDLRSHRAAGDLEDGPEKSILAYEHKSDDQKSWLKSELQASTAVWKFLISSSVFNPNSKATDSWAEFPTERQELLDFLDENHITGVMVISGDIHSGGGIDDGTNSGIPEITVATTNYRADNCTGECGEWSEGIWIGNDPRGFAAIKVHQDNVVLHSMGSDGKVRQAYVEIAETLPGK